MANLVWIIATIIVTGFIMVMDDASWDRKKPK
jgi:hypothetical protein